MELIQDNAHIDLLITRYLSGEASAKEIRELEAWMDASEVNKKYFSHFKFAHEKAFYTYRKYNADEGWQSLKAKMEASSEKEKVRVLNSAQSYWFRIAAGIAIIVGITSLLFWLLKPAETEKETIAVVAHDSIKTNLLADNSEVVLHKNSSIEYSKNFGKTNREVKLKGEAYFKVEHMADKPFIVDAGGVFIKDIGTAFNIKAFPDSDKIEVFVESGIVDFYKGTSSIRLNKGESAVYNKSENTFSRIDSDTDNLLAYKTKFFRFNNARLWEVTEQLNSVYNTRIRLLNKNIANCRITVTFENENIDNIVQVISETLGLQVVVDDQGFALKGNTCTNE